jgi:hypothetical protein
MPAEDRWRALHRRRFADLPFDCGNRSDPGIIYSEDLRDWSDKATTPDQYRMEAYIDRYDLREKRVLHVGVGNSGLARRFHRRVREIVGTTIDEPELKVARSLALSNYQVVLHNKYSGRAEDQLGHFDFILDNNPTSPCCCITHLAQLFDFYTARLAPAGQIVSDREGLEWVPDGSSSRWSFSFEDLEAIAALAELEAYRITGNVFVLSRCAPPAAGFVPLARHSFRRVSILATRGLRKAVRVAMKLGRQ